MKSLRRLAVWVAVLTAGSAIAAERKVAMQELPAPVQEAVREHTKGLMLVGLSEETENGETLYEAEVRANGRTWDILIDPTGKVITEEKEISLSSLPEPARAAIEQAAEGGTIKKLESVTKDGTTLYEAQIKKDGKKVEVVVAPDGTIQKN